MGEVLGFAGRAGAGKTTAALILHDFVQPQQGHHMEFSDPIVTVAEGWMNAASDAADKAAFMDCLGDVLQTTYEVAPSGLIAAGLEAPVLDQYMGTRDQQSGAVHTIAPETKGHYRGLLEWLGKGALEHLSPTFWGDMVEYKTKSLLRDGADLVTVSGVRSKLDAQSVRNVGGTIIRLHRDRTAKALPTETSVNAWQADFDVLNHGSLDELTTNIQDIWRVVLVRDDYPSGQMGIAGGAF